MFVQFSECQAPLHKCEAPLAYRRLSASDVVETVTSKTETWLKFRDETETLS